MKAIIKFTTILFLAPMISGTASSQSFLKKIENDVSITVNAGKINGKILMTNADENCPIVVIISGSGPTDMDGNNPQIKNNSLKYLASNLAENGIASLRFDKRMIASSSVNQLEKDVRFDDYVSDVSDWVDYLAKNHKFTKIFIAGHSEGALIGALVAESNSNVAGFVSMAGGGRHFADIIEEQYQGQPISEINQVKEINKSLKAGQLISNIPKSLYGLFRTSVQPYMISLYKYTPTDVIAKIKVPILIVQGTTDIQVAVIDAKLLKQAAQKAELIIIENMNHTLKFCKSLDKMEQYQKTYANPNTTIMSELVTVICNFVKNN